MKSVCRTPEDATAELDAQADVAPHIQDDFDLEEGVLQELDVKDNPDFQVFREMLVACCTLDRCAIICHVQILLRTYTTGETAKADSKCTN